LSFLIDTNVISEVRKGARCDANVAAWYAAIEDDDLYLSVLVLGEIRRGIERARAGEPAKARALEQWLSVVSRSFGNRILPVDQRVAEEWGRIRAKRSAPVIDALLAATARVYDLTLATRNTADVAGLGAEVVNPFEAIA
jgi:predicted nucleic acid-binding protein